MSGCAKGALIGCGALLVLGVILIGLVYWWGSTRGAEMAEAAVAAGRQTDEAGCMALAQERLAGGAGFAEAASTGAWLTICLQNAAETPGFCEAPPTSCPEGDAMCQALVQMRQTYCEQGRTKQPGAGSGFGGGVVVEGVQPEAPAQP